ncbi:MAG: heme A synthase [Bacteroidetes bacterium]|nr:heme A synthase [bacterium]NBP63409.1 heme A synthase [Bacteroidota bacterium]
MNTLANRIFPITTILVLLVIAAGSIVRSTQSGMGCPDWPTCYGLIIPPTTISQLPPDYQNIYANDGIPAEAFDATRTWIEYLNRILGALLGLSVLLQTIISVRTRKENLSRFWASLVLLFLTGFQGWLGAMVVSSNLAPYRITIHMMVAFMILIIANIATYSNRIEKVSDSRLYKFILLAMGMLFIQLGMGTQVREEIDVLAKALNFSQRNIWIDNLSTLFPIHRSFSLLILLVNGYIVYTCKSRIDFWSKVKIPSMFLVAALLISVCSGIVMTYLSVPAMMQPIHLICASIIIWSLHRLSLQFKP